MASSKSLLLKIRMFFNNLSPLQISYRKDASGDYIVDEHGNPSPEGFEPPSFLKNWRWWLVIAVVVYCLWQLIKQVLTLKLQKR